jgi:hypothetical protein
MMIHTHRWYAAANTNRHVCARLCGTLLQTSCRSAAHTIQLPTQSTENQLCVLLGRG